MGTVRVPTLHVWSTGDAFLGRAATEATAAHVDAPYRLEVLEGMPHWLPELAADRVAELVTAHVRAHRLTLGLRGRTPWGGGPRRARPGRHRAADGGHPAPALVADAARRTAMPRPASSATVASTSSQTR